MDNKNKTHNEILAESLAKSLREFAAHPERIDNFESYLSAHYSDWFKKYIRIPEDLIYEFESFAEMV